MQSEQQPFRQVMQRFSESEQLEHLPCSSYSYSGVLPEMELPKMIVRLRVVIRRSPFPLGR